MRDYVRAKFVTCEEGEFFPTSTNFEKINIYEENKYSQADNKALINHNYLPDRPFFVR